MEKQNIKFTCLSTDSKLLFNPSSSFCNLFSNNLLYYFLATESFIAFGPLSDLRTQLSNSNSRSKLPFTIYTQIPLSNVKHLSCSYDDLLLWTITDSLISIYNIQNIQNPIQITPPFIQTIDIKPNPEYLLDSCAFLQSNGSVYLVNTRSDLSIIQSKNITAICWSRKGKQLACGTIDGNILQVTPQGIVKKTHLPPSDIKIPIKVQDILWLEDYIFICIYASIPENSHDPPEIFCYIVSIDKISKSISYKPFDDPCPTFGMAERPHKYYIQILKSWGKSFKYMLIFSNSASADIGVIGCGDDMNFENWIVPEPFNLVMPLDDSQNDTWTVGMALDVSSTTSLPPLTPDDDPIPPVPILWILNNVGWLSGYNCLDTDAIRNKDLCSSMKNTDSPLSTTANSESLVKESSSLFETTKTVASFGSTSSSFETTAAKPAASFGSTASPFGTTAAKPAATFDATASPFGTTKPAATFGSTASSFETTAAKPATTFGSTASPFGTTAAKPATTFGSTASSFETTKPAATFGSTALPFGTTAAKPAASFGSTASPFGTTAAKPATTFGSTASSFETTAAKPATTFGSTASPFGTTAAKPATTFGSTASSFETTKPAATFGSTALPFGTTKPAASFGSTASPFGTTAAKPATTFDATALPFGSTAAKPTATFGSTASPFETTSAKPTATFGSTSSSFETTKPATTFGSTASPFETTAAKPAPTFGSTALPFGTTAAKPTATFGSTALPFGTTAAKPTATFGSTASPFGTTAAKPAATFDSTESPLGTTSAKSDNSFKFAVPSIPQTTKIPEAVKNSKNASLSATSKSIQSKAIESRSELDSSQISISNIEIPSEKTSSNAQMDDESQKLKELGDVIKKQMKNVVEKTSNLSDVKTWNLSNISETQSKTIETLEELTLFEDKLLKLKNDRAPIQSQIVTAFAKKEESAKLMKIVMGENSQTEKESDDQELGPEAQELRDSLLKKTKLAETSIDELSEYFTIYNNRMASQKKGDTVVGKSRDWYTLCQTVTRITSSAISTSKRMDDLERKFNNVKISQPTPKKVKPVVTPDIKIARSGGTFGLSEEDIEEENLKYTVPDIYSEERLKAKEYLISLFGNPNRKINVQKPKRMPQKKCTSRIPAMLNNDAWTKPSSKEVRTSTPIENTKSFESKEPPQSNVISGSDIKKSVPSPFNPVNSSGFLFKPVITPIISKTEILDTSISYIIDDEKSFDSTQFSDSISKNLTSTKIDKILPASSDKQMFVPTQDIIKNNIKPQEIKKERVLTLSDNTVQSVKPGMSSALQPVDVLEKSKIPEMLFPQKSKESNLKSTQDKNANSPQQTFDKAIVKEVPSKSSLVFNKTNQVSAATAKESPNPVIDRINNDDSKTKQKSEIIKANVVFPAEDKLENPFLVNNPDPKAKAKSELFFKPIIKASNDDDISNEKALKQSITSKPEPKLDTKSLLKSEVIPKDPILNISDVNLVKSPVVEPSEEPSEDVLPVIETEEITTVTETSDKEIDGELALNTLECANISPNVDAAEIKSLDSTIVSVVGSINEHKEQIVTSIIDTQVALTSNDTKEIIEVIESEEKSPGKIGSTSAPECDIIDENTTDDLIEANLDEIEDAMEADIGTTSFFGTPTTTINTVNPMFAVKPPSQSGFGTSLAQSPSLNKSLEVTPPSNAFGQSSFGTPTRQPHGTLPESVFATSTSNSGFGTIAQSTNVMEASKASLSGSPSPAFGMSSFGQTSQQFGSTFGQSSALNSNNSAANTFGSAFGVSSFGASSNAPKFSAITSNSGFASFAQAKAPTFANSQGENVFGQSSSGGSFGQPATFGQSPAFGQPSGFGQASVLGNQPNASTFGQSSFGQNTAFGQSTGQSVFGQSSAFGQSKTGTVFGQESSFGQTTGSTGFGQFGQPSSGFGQSSAFGQAPSGFGQQSAFGQPAGFGQTSTFGQSSSGAFGQTTGQTGFGQQSAFGQASGNSPGSSFGSQNPSSGNTFVQGSAKIAPQFTSHRG